jgi:hypothetical protein
MGYVEFWLGIYLFLASALFASKGVFSVFYCLALKGDASIKA